MTALPPLPIDAVLPELEAALARGGNAVVVAEPAAGKTTRIPLWLAGQPWLEGRRIVMLEPRRLAVRAAARHMARQLGEASGETVGYRVRFEERVSPATRIEILTEGILTRRLQSDPAIGDVGVLIFDEFHERSLEGDLGLALALEIQAAIRGDLRILAMSATLDAERLSALLGDAPVLRAKGRIFPVATHHLGRATRQTVASDVADAVIMAVSRHDASILAFLPGEGEIRRAEALLGDAGLPRDVTVLPLYGSLGPEQQDRALAPSPAGARKVVLATTIAETSLTIDGIGIVIDGGFKRAPRFDPSTGMARLETVRVSAAAAEQRRGRAGRQGPGVCYRLWPEEETRALARHDAPEILNADLASFVLEAANWGARDVAQLRLIDPPPPGSVAQAKDLLMALDAITPEGAITDHGRRMAALPLHPRLAHMVIRGAERGWGRLAADVAALLGERDLLRGAADANLLTRLELLRGATGADPATTRRIRAAARQIADIARISDGAERGDAGALLALAYPDRVAKARDRHGQYRLAGGGGAEVDEADPLARESYLAVATTDGDPAKARIFLAAPLAETTLRELFADRIRRIQSVHWDGRKQAVVAHEQVRLGELVLAEKPLADPDPELTANALLDGLRSSGLDALSWSETARSLRQRVRMIGQAFPEQPWPDWSDEALLGTLGAWLRPHIPGLTRVAQLRALDLVHVLREMLPPVQRRQLETLLPATLTVPSGSIIAITYDSEGGPVLRVKLQEMFGARTVPRLAEGRIALRLELLSPAGRPLAVTSDLGSFWVHAYPEVRAEMRGRYPKHPWPEDPLTAVPTRRAKSRNRPP